MEADKIKQFVIPSCQWGTHALEETVSAVFELEKLDELRSSSENLRPLCYLVWLCASRGL